MGFKIDQKSVQKPDAKKKRVLEGILGTKKVLQGGTRHSRTPTTQRAGAVGRGRGGEIPSPGTGGLGDLGLKSVLHALRHKAPADLGGYAGIPPTPTDGKRSKIIENQGFRRN